jgi:hypothetical protein
MRMHTLNNCVYLTSDLKSSPVQKSNQCNPVVPAVFLQKNVARTVCALHKRVADDSGHTDRDTTPRVVTCNQSSTASSSTAQADDPDLFSLLFIHVESAVGSYCDVVQAACMRMHHPQVTWARIGESDRWVTVAPSYNFVGNERFPG